MKIQALLIALSAAAALTACQRSDTGSRGGTARGNTGSQLGEQSTKNDGSLATGESRQNQSGSLDPAIEGAGATDAAGVRYTVDRVDKKEQKIFLRGARAIADVKGIDKSYAGGSAAKEPQSGLEMVITFAEFQSLNPSAQGSDAVEKSVKEGDTVTVVKDKSGRPSKITVEDLPK